MNIFQAVFSFIHDQVVQKNINSRKLHVKAVWNDFLPLRFGGITYVGFHHTKIFCSVIRVNKKLIPTMINEILDILHAWEKKSRGGIGMIGRYDPFLGRYLTSQCHDDILFAPCFFNSEKKIGLL